MLQKSKRFLSLTLIFGLILLFGSLTQPNAVAAPQSAVVADMYTDMSRYDPGQNAQIFVDVSNAGSSRWVGSVELSVYHLDTLVYDVTERVSVASNSMETIVIEWVTPSTDFTGYLAKGQIGDSFKTTAIDVSSDFSVFPRYGYVADFPVTETQAESEEKINRLSKDYKINAVQFYDWMWRHDELIKRSAGQVEDSWIDLFNRTIGVDTLQNQIAAAQDANMAAMAYVMSYAAREGYDQFGIQPEWGIFKDQNNRSQHDVDFQNGTYLWLFNPANADWQNYITGQYLDAVQTMGFDGLQIDQMGQRNPVYDFAGREINLEDTFSELINAAKARLSSAGSKITFNVVDGTIDGWALRDVMLNAQTDFDYSEIWWESNSYSALQNYIEQFRMGNGGKALVLAAYMNYNENTGVGYEAETAAMSGVSVNSNHYGYTGNGFIDGFESGGDSVTFTISVTEAGLVPLVFRYANATGFEATRNLYIDNAFSDTVFFHNQSNWGTWVSDAYSTPYLEQGIHTITLQFDAGNQHAINLDSMTLGYFNDSSVRLADAAIAASGASHIEMGANPYETVMLPHEYYPNTSKVMGDSLSDAMEQHYDFITAYENLLYDRDIVFGDQGTQHIDISGHAVSGSGESGKIWTIYRQKEAYDILHFINLTAENDTSWRNSNIAPERLLDLETKYYIGPDAVIDGVYLASPDSQDGLSVSLPYTTGTDATGAYVSFSMPSLAYWNMVYIKRTIDSDGTYEAEDAVKVGVSTNTDHGGYSGTGFVDRFDGEDKSVSFTVNIPEDGEYSLKFRYANATGGEAARALFVDGKFAGITYFGNLPDWETWDYGETGVNLKAGVHKIVLLYGTNEYNAINLDCLVVEPGL